MKPERSIALLCLVLAISTQVSAKAVCRTTRATKQLEISLANNTEHHTFVVLGATGDLAKREIYPALWYLYRDNLLPPSTLILGFARREMTVEQLREHVQIFVKVRPEEKARYDDFWKINRYFRGHKTETENYDGLAAELAQIEKQTPNGTGNRAFYLALPPAVFESSTTQIRRACMAKGKSWTRLALEKPFGHDSASAKKLTEHLSKLFSHEQIFLSDHFLGYEMVQNLMALRFGNRLLTSSWDRHSIASIEVELKENFGIEERGEYFDANGMIRDVMENHLLQIMSLIAMEKPKSTAVNDVRNEKVKLLKSVRPILLKDVVLGQYVGNPNSSDPREHLGYAENPTVKNKNTLQNTFALTVLKVDNERWRGVPFLIRAGKGLHVNQTNVIIQFKEVEKDIFNGESKRNKLIIRIGANKLIQAKIMSKTPGFSTNIEEISIDFDYDAHYKNVNIPAAYERMILDILHGTQLNFVRIDELTEGWRIFTPILHEIEKNKIPPHKYVFGSNGPKEADALEKKYNFL